LTTIDIKGGVGNRFQHRIDYRIKALGQSLAILGNADVPTSPQAQNGRIGEEERRDWLTGHGVECPWLVCNRNSTVNQLLLLGVKADGLSLREETAGDRIFTNSLAAEEWLHDGPKGRPSHLLAD
jgi:hypothetical protein